MTAYLYNLEFGDFLILRTINNNKQVFKPSTFVEEMYLILTNIDAIDVI